MGFVGACLGRQWTSNSTWNGFILRLQPMNFHIRSEVTLSFLLTLEGKHWKIENQRGSMWHNAFCIKLRNSFVPERERHGEAGMSCFLVKHNSLPVPFVGNHGLNREDSI